MIRRGYDHGRCMCGADDCRSCFPFARRQAEQDEAERKADDRDAADDCRDWDDE